MKRRNIIRQFQALPLGLRAIIILVALSMLIVTANSAYSMVHQHLIKTMTVGAEYTDVVYSDYAFIQAEESLMTAKASGSVDIAVKEGERVPKNHEVFSITSTTKDDKTKTEPYYAPISGIVSYHIDGYESKTDINEIKGLDFRSIYEDTFKQDGRDETPKDAVQGEVYAKVIDNLKTAYLYMSYDPDKQKLFSERGDVFRIRFPELSEQTTGTVEDIIDAENGRKFCKIALGPVSEAFLTYRVVQAEIYQTETATLDLDKDALVYNKDGDAGVYIVSGGTVQWQAVKVIKENGNDVECETLPEGTIVVLTPHRVSPGDVVKGS